MQPYMRLTIEISTIRRWNREALGKTDRFAILLKFVTQTCEVTH